MNQWHKVEWDDEWWCFSVTFSAFHTRYCIRCAEKAANWASNTNKWEKTTDSEQEVTFLLCFHLSDDIKTVTDGATPEPVETAHRVLKFTSILTRLALLSPPDKVWTFIQSSYTKILTGKQQMFTNTTCSSVWAGARLVLLVNSAGFLFLWAKNVQKSGVSLTNTQKEAEKLFPLF